MGRQPWTVFGVLKTANSASVAVSAGEILFTLIVFVVLYIILGVVDAFLLCKYAKQGVEPVQQVKEESQEEQLVVAY